MKWRVLALAATLVCAGFSGSTEEPSLREAARGCGMLIGTAVRPAQLSEAAYASTLAREFNMLEPEDALKWEVVHPQRESFDFSQADRIVEFAARHNMKVRGHTLVWHQQNPPWLTQGRFTSDQLAKLLETHIKTVVGHYRGKIFAWDVVNEAFDEQVVAKFRGTIWYNQPGIGFPRQGFSYLAACFRWAHEADPQALLFYNEAEAEQMGWKADELYALVREFKRVGVPIDGIGLQMHIHNLHPEIASISANIGRFTALGIQVHITEMDVALPVDADGNARPEDLRRQADIYREVANACLAHRGCTAIQTWGFTDKYSWIGSHSKQTQGAALLLDREYRAKPAYEAVKRSLVVGR